MDSVKEIWDEWHNFSMYRAEVPEKLVRELLQFLPKGKYTVVQREWERFYRHRYPMVGMPLWITVNEYAYLMQCKADSLREEFYCEYHCYRNI